MYHKAITSLASKMGTHSAKRVYPFLLKCMRCNKCGLDKGLSSFYKRKRGGFLSTCKSCRKEYAKSDERKAYEKEYRDSPEKRHIANTRFKEHRKTTDYKKWKKEYHSRRYRDDVEYKLQHLVRNRLLNSIKNGVKKGSAVRDLGCSIEELRMYLESKFQPGMSWENHGLHGWHIDHIRPLSSFDLGKEDEIKKACHYTNLQPLWASENIKKCAKIKI